MPVLLVHLSDLHVKTGAEAVFDRWDVLCRAIQVELDEGIEACVIIFNGDAAFSGRPEEFAGATDLLNHLRSHVATVRPGIAVHVLTVPGNHDCDLTSEDSEARMTLRKTVDGSMPSQSVARVLLSAQAGYYNFAKQFGTDSRVLSPDAAYYCWLDIPVKGKIVRFHLLNSSWTSVLGETDDLRFPLDAFAPPDKPEAHYSVAVLHHPVHWFLMPEVRRNLRDRLEAHVDLILTGHEHENEASRRLILEGGEIAYIEGGVLSDVENPDSCFFNTIRLDFENDKQVVKRFRYQTDHFELDGGSNETSLAQNRLRVDRQLRLTSKFEEWLDELEDPLTHPREEELRLSHLFTYPDLRKVMMVGGGDDSGGKDSELIDRVKSEEVVGELMRQERSFITGGDKAGKTCLLKRLFVELQQAGYVPLFIKAGNIVRSGNIDHFRKQIADAVKDQYLFLTPAAFEQLPIDKKVLLADDFQESPSDAKVRRRVLDAIAERFGKSILAANSDFYIELIGRRNSEYAPSLLLHQRYEITEFGRQRFEELALRWTSLGRADDDPGKLRTLALELCEKVHSLIAVAGLPHTPWLLAVILEHDESPDATTAAKNGDYGHLYHAVITVRLARSRFTRFNLNGKFTYLSELAYHLYKNNRAILGDLEARQLHSELTNRFDFTLDFEQVRQDLVETRMLRLDGDELAFRHKYVFAFFVAYWLYRNIHKNEAQKAIKELSERLHHDVSANVLVFLSHLTDQPIVLQEMRAAAASLFHDAKPANMAEEVQSLSQLCGVDSFFALPTTAPEVNRKLLQEMQDDGLARQRQHSHDGRSVKALPEAEPEGKTEIHSALRELRASLRTIRILGQVLRNKAQSMESQDKVTLMEEVIGIERRVLGYLYGFLDQLSEMVLSIRKRLMRVMVEAKQTEKYEAAEAKDEERGDVKSMRLARTELRELWSEAEAFATRYWFDMYWLGSAGIIKHVASAIGSRDLDSTLAKIKAKDDAIPIQLVELASRLHRRTPNIPVDELVKLHKWLKKTNNKIARVVLEALVWERLLLFETNEGQRQAICKEMDIKVPAVSFDPTRKKFLPNKVSKRSRKKK